MVSFSFKSNEDIEAYRDITDDVLESEFVPYACHYNPHTLITKNGELLQVIKITGLDHERLGHDEADLRAAIREAIENGIPSDAFAIWLHTVRRRADLSVPGVYGNAFARELQESWEERNRFKDQYNNEVYISIAYEGQGVALSDIRNLLHGIFPSQDKNWRQEYLDDAYDTLNDVTDAVLGALGAYYGAGRLGLYERDGVFYSEISEFLEKLINLTDRRMAVTEEDLSHHLTSGEITFGFNAMEVRSNNRRNFAAILTLKEYKESSLPAIDSFLHLPMEFVITQLVNFVNPSVAVDSYQDQKMLTDLSGDKKFARLSEIDAIVEGDTSNPTSFGEQQISVFILAASITLLERNLRHAVQCFADCGIVAIREDLRLENCYWAQLPGNFEFVKRTRPNRTSRIAGFAHLHNFPVGRPAGNRWGDAVTVFHTASGVPYFFNFHQGESGHTSIIGPPGSGKAVLANFLITQALKFDPRILYVDASGISKVFMGLIGGRCYALTTTPGETTAPLNPFSLPDTPDNREFLARWLAVLLRMTGASVNDEQKSQIRSALEATLSGTRDGRHLGRFAELLAERSPSAAAAFAPWVKGGKYGHVFTQTEDVFDHAPEILAFDVQPVLHESAILIPAFSYLLQRGMEELDAARPGILLLDEAWTLLKNAHVAGNIKGWLSGLTRRNAIAVLMTESIEDAGVQPFTPTLMAGMATQLYLPNDDPGDAYQEAFGLSEHEIAYLDVLDKEERHFLIKRAGEAVVAELNLVGMDRMIAGLSGRLLEESDDEDAGVFAHGFKGE